VRRRFREAILDDGSPGDVAERPAPSPLRTQQYPQYSPPRDDAYSISTPDDAALKAAWRARTASEEEAASPLLDRSKWESTPPLNEKHDSCRMNWGRIALAVGGLLTMAVTVLLLLQQGSSSAAVAPVTGPIKCTYAGLAELKSEVHARRYRRELNSKAAEQELKKAKRMWEMQCKPQRSSKLRWSRNHDEL